MKLNEEGWISIYDDCGRYGGRKLESTFIGAFKTLIIRLDGNIMWRFYHQQSWKMKDEIVKLSIKIPLETGQNLKSKVIDWWWYFQAVNYRISLQDPMKNFPGFKVMKFPNY
jgi:hypothetical protein